MKFNEIQKKCLSCVNARLTTIHQVRCGWWTHPGIVGGTGTESVKYCPDYVQNNTGIIYKDTIHLTPININSL